MKSFFKSIVDWFRQKFSLTYKEIPPVYEQPTVTEFVAVVPEPDQLEPEQTETVDKPSDQPTIHSETTEESPEEKANRVENFFRHTRTRCAERYGFVLDRQTYDRWNSKLKAGKMLQVMGINETIYWVTHNQHAVLLAVKDGYVVTAIPPRHDYLKAALGRNRIQYQQTGKKSAKNAGRQNRV